MIKTISVIGGDLRQLTVYNLLAEDGFDVLLQGFDKLEDTENTDDIEKLAGADAVALPMPVTADGMYVNSVYAREPVRLDALITAAKPETVFFGGRADAPTAAKLRARGLRFYDYLAREELAVKNAALTAEGAAGIAMAETPFALRGAKCLVLGYGRVGKALAETLNALGAEVTAAARSYAARAAAECHGSKTVGFAELDGEIGKYDIIFNTVPAAVLDKAALGRVKCGALIIDLASKPGGVDFDTAKNMGLKVIWALSLPGKTAPFTAGRIIKETILNILEEME